MFRNQSIINMEAQKRKSWFGRNWLWVVPVGGCLTLIVLAVLGVGSLFYGVTSLLKNSTPYEYALEQAQENPEVVAQLGETIEADGMISGNLTYTNNKGEANIQIPIKGSKGEGTLFVVGEKYGEDWTYEKLYVLIKDSQEKINLLDKVIEGY